MSDLRVLGKRDFKELLRWRESLRVILGLDQSKEEKRKEREKKEKEEKEKLEKENAEHGDIDVVEEVTEI